MQNPRFFNNSGPVNVQDHFCVNPIARIDTKKVWQLVLQKKYFLLQGPKQSGKTSYLLALARTINRDGRFKCLYFNVESLRGIQDNLEESIKSILFEIASRARDTFDDGYLDDMVVGILERRGSYHALNELLTQWSKKSDRPIVLFVDEIDTLKGAVLTSFLSQIRAGYDKRPGLFPQSILFCGTHDVIEKQFNVKDATIRINYLRRAEMEELIRGYAGQGALALGKGALDRVWDYSNGQPWIVSTIAAELFQEMVPAKGMRAIEEPDVVEAALNVIEKKGNHLEYLGERLRDPRVKKVFVPMLAGSGIEENLLEEDVEYIRELGLVRESNKLEISNRLYKELVPRVLFNPVLYLINPDMEDFADQAGSIDWIKLLKSFQQFFRNHAERLVRLIDYGNAGFALVFQALLQRLTEWNVSISRDYGLNRGFVSIEASRRYPVPTKLLFLVRYVNPRTSETYRQGLARLVDETIGLAELELDPLSEVHLAFIHANFNLAWEEKHHYQKKERNGRTIHVWGF